MKPRKLTKQGVRDLGGNSRVRQPQPDVGCSHLFEPYLEYDCRNERMVRRMRCGFCQEVQ